MERQQLRRNVIVGKAKTIASWLSVAVFFGNLSVHPSERPTTSTRLSDCVYPRFQFSRQPFFLNNHDGSNTNTTTAPRVLSTVTAAIFLGGRERIHKIRQFGLTMETVREEVGKSEDIKAVGYRNGRKIIAKN